MGLSGKNFLLGIGAQKAGTSWLSDYLGRHEQVAMGEVKELHFFNQLYLEPRDLGMASRKLSRASEMIKKLGKAGGKVTPEFLSASIECALMQFQPELYGRYFERIAAANPNARIVGEYTPGYSAMDKAAMTKTAAYLRALGVRPRVLLLVREPESRCRSAFAMYHRRKRKTGPAATYSPDMDFERFCAWSHTQSLTRFEKMIPAAIEAFGAENLHVTLYEELFSEQAVSNICAFLGIDYLEPDFSKMVNRSPTRRDSALETGGDFAELYRDTYKFCERFFGKSVIDTAWRRS